jgi:two-component system, OmpR family, response regulator VicR
MKIAIIEDDLRIIGVLKLTIKMRWPLAIFVTCQTGQDGILLVEKEKPSLIMLDLGLPDIDGLEVLKQIRTFSDTPVVILTVRREERDIVEGLELGADEYIVKPFRQMEILARIQCIIRRKYGQTDESPLTIDGLNLVPIKRRLVYQGKEILLTLSESKIMETLMHNAGRTVSTSTLAESIWGESYPGCENAIRVYMRRLRTKLETEPSSPQLILTKPGMGYCLIKQQ